MQTMLTLNTPQPLNLLLPYSRILNWEGIEVGVRLEDMEREECKKVSGIRGRGK